MLGTLARFDVAVTALEAVAAIAFLLHTAGSTHLGAIASLEALTQGHAAGAWWAGFVACGLIAPFAMELAHCSIVRQNGSKGKALALAAAFVLVGALCMRWAVVDSGVHRELELESVQSELALDLESTGAFELAEENMDGALTL